MKFEEMLPYLRGGVKIEYQRRVTGAWSDITPDDRAYVSTLMELNFRVKPKKVKKYQIIYQIHGDPPDHFRMSNEHYTGQAEFEETYQTLANAHSCFSPSVKEVEE